MWVERYDDLFVYFVFGYFKKRDLYVWMLESFKWDIKNFFGKYVLVRNEGKVLFYCVFDVDVIYRECENVKVVFLVC